MNQTRFSRRMGEHYSQWRSSQCVIEPMQEDRIPSYDLALYAVAVIALIVLIGVL